MPDPRASGVLLHPTSFPGSHGVGDLGQKAYEFVDFLARSKQSLWQILPLGPVGIGDSPYAASSAFAGNPLLLSLDVLASDGLLTDSELTEAVTSDGSTDIAWLREYKLPVLRKAALRFLSGDDKIAPELIAGFGEFRERTANWLEDFALFTALATAYDGLPWTTWPDAGLVRREKSALEAARQEHAEEIAIHRALQYLFYYQWQRLRTYARERGIRIIGDIPIFVAHDSADVWAHPELFLLDETGNPTAVAGVPPDYFSETGQLWGNPLYRWDMIAQTGYRWWIDRVRGALEQVDIIRLDHFRGFYACWSVPASEETAENGCWVRGPGETLFTALTAALGKVPIIAEDLGVITPNVRALRDGLGLPGMKVLQFAFSGGSKNPYLPHNYIRNSVVYTGTHDNDTTRGWFATADEDTREAARLYLDRPDLSEKNVSSTLIVEAMRSVADWSVAPLQDLLDFDSGARMNTPGQLGGNWAWRYPEGALSEGLADWLAGLSLRYGRAPLANSAEDDDREEEPEVEEGGRAIFP